MTEETPHTKLYNKLLPVLKEGMENKEELSSFAYKVLRVLFPHPPNPSVKDEVLARYGGKPVCWLCDHPIYMDEPRNTDACFTLDHVIPAHLGGQKTPENLEPAHQLCNSARHSKSTNRVNRKLDQMFAYLKLKGSTCPQT